MMSLSDFYFIHPSSSPDIGPNVKTIGRMPRHFVGDKPAPTWRDPLMSQFIRGPGSWAFDEKILQDPMPFSRNPRTLQLARAALRRYDRPCDPLGDRVKSYYRTAALWADAEFGRYVRNSRIYSYDEAQSTLDPSKAAGAPWSLYYASKGQYWASPDAIMFDQYWDLLCTDAGPPSVCAQIGKDQLQAFEDNFAGKMRTVTSMDVNHVLSHAIFCADQNKRFQSAALVTSSAYGMSLLNGGANRLVHMMERDCKKPSTLELDGKRFDARFSSFLFDLIRDLRWSWLSDEWKTPDNKKRFDNIYRLLWSSPLLGLDGVLYSRYIGNPSGQLCTTVDNTIKNFMDMCVLWMLCTDPKFHFYAVFSSKIRLCLYGDDVNITVHHDFHHLFNADSILSASAHIDMEYTFASMDFRWFHECTFLGHSFSRSQLPGTSFWFWLPMISCVKMVCSYLCWGSDQDSPTARLEALCGIRNETFGCPHCRKFYSQFYEWVLPKYGIDYFPGYLPDVSLWALYTGLSESEFGLFVQGKSSSDQLENPMAYSKFQDYFHDVSSHYKINSRQLDNRYRKSTAGKRQLNEGGLKPYLNKGFNVFAAGASSVLDAALDSARGLKPHEYRPEDLGQRDGLSEPQIVGGDKGEFGAFRGHEHGPRVPDSAPASGPDGQTAIAITSGEASNPGPTFLNLPKGEMKKELKREVKRDVRKSLGRGRVRGNPAGKPRAVGWQKEKKKSRQGGEGSSIVMSSAPSSIGTNIRIGQPKITNKRGIVTVSHMEMVGIVATPATVPNTTGYCELGYWYVNPGQVATFPYLSTISRDFETYRFRLLQFIFIPRVGTNAVGDVMLIPDYDPNDSPVADEQTAGSYVDSVICSDWKTATCNLNPKRMLGTSTRKSCRYNAYQANTSLTDYDVGSFSMYSSGVTASTGLGRLLVRYVCDFYTPRKLDPVSEAYILSAQLPGNNVTTVNCFGDGTANPFGGLAAIWNAGGTITLNRPGAYLLECGWGGTSMGSMTATLTSSDTNSVIVAYTAVIGGTTAYQKTFRFTCTTMTTTITMTIGGAPTLNAGTFQLMPFSLSTNEI